VSYPNGQYEYLGITVPSYGLRNENRLLPTSSLDISATLTPRKNEGRNWKGEWVLVVFTSIQQENAFH
jgi:hypothetical protein